MRTISGLQVNDPTGAFYVFPDVSAFFGKSYSGQTIQNSDDFCMYLLGEGLVACTAGASFGCPNNVRMSYASSEEQLLEAVSRIKKALDKLS